MNQTHNQSATPCPATRIPHPRRAFTLVELLVVITIISVLAALITVAAIGALKKAQEARIKAEINQIASAVDEYKNKTTAYPPNSQTDGSAGPIDEAGVMNDVRRHLRQLAPRTQEPDDWVLVLTGQNATVPKNFNSRTLAGGLTAGEAVVFWLGGFSSDPKYPISGEGGPSYSIGSYGTTTNNTGDPIESRKWIFPFDVSRLGPRTADGFFDDSKGRFVEFTDAKGKLRRINFWQYTPPKSTQPYMYFDTSRHPAYDMTATGTKRAQYDPPGATADAKIANGAVSVHAFKKQNPAYSSANAATTAPVTFVNPDKYQVLHCGLDGAWDTDAYDAFNRMSADNGTKNTPNDFLLFPTGPFVGEVADTIVNFAPETRIEDAQK
jgi:prepilin-type N-terminal cleavage/methylation domain-containing protein